MLKEKEEREREREKVLVLHTALQIRKIFIPEMEHSSHLKYFSLAFCAAALAFWNSLTAFLPSWMAWNEDGGMGTWVWRNASMREWEREYRRMSVSAVEWECWYRIM